MRVIGHLGAGRALVEHPRETRVFVIYDRDLRTSQGVYWRSKGQGRWDALRHIILAEGLLLAA